MSEYKRLTKRKDGVAYGYCGRTEEIAATKRYGLQRGCFECSGIIDRLAELEDKIESVLWVELPCKVGDVFFGFPNKTDAPNQYFKYTVKGIEYRQDGVYLRTNYDMCFKYGDEAFMTEAEAEMQSVLC